MAADAEDWLQDDRLVVLFVIAALASLGWYGYGMLHRVTTRRAG